MSNNGESGAATAERLAGKDLNNSGNVVNLVVCGNSRFYDYSWLEDQLETWVKYNEYPDMILLGGASGVDYLAERWADNNRIPLAIFNEAWSSPRPDSEQDSGRPEADASLADTMLDKATHVLAFPGPDSVWTRKMIDMAKAKGLPIIEVELPMTKGQ